MKHAELSENFNADEKRVNWHDETLWFIREKRDRASSNIAQWELLREWGSNIKDHALSHLDEYLVQFEEMAIKNGIQVHWASDADEHNRIVLEIARKHDVRQIVKSKSMLTEECRMNEFLRGQGVDVVDTDLGERIVQLRHEQPSHIVLPAIHLKKEEVSDTFHQHLHTEKNNFDPQYLARAARKDLRQKFISAQMAITGVNFAVAETGGFVICTNEGNADMGVHAAKVHVASIGIEKVIPRAADLAVFLRLLARSATGQPITVYSSHYSKPGPGKEMHVIIVDNGRTRQLGRKDFRASLKCIRCAACFNTCPVYRRSGGHSYHNTVAGPIGSILNPNLDMRKNADLPFASTLCGSCSNVCPVKIDIHQQLWKWRQVVVENGYVDTGKKSAMKGMAMILSSPFLFRNMGAVLRKTMNLFPWLFASKKFNKWYTQREMPQSPGSSFRDWYIKNRK